MRIHILFITIILCTAHNAFSQQYEYNDAHQRPAYIAPGIDVNRIAFGAYIAPDISWLHPTVSVSNDGRYFVNSNGSKAGYSWGLLVDYFFAPNYGIATGFDLNTTGGKILSALNTNNVFATTPNTVLNADFNYNLQFLEVPFNLKLRSDPLPAARGLRIYGQIGLTAGVNISKKATYKVIYNDANAMQQTTQGDNEKLVGALTVAPVMLQMNIGAGVEYPLAQKLHLYTGLFFNNGFLPSAVEPQNFTLAYKGSFTNGNIRLNNLGLRVGLFF